MQGPMYKGFRENNEPIPIREQPSIARRCATGAIIVLGLTGVGSTLLYNGPQVFVDAINSRKLDSTARYDLQIYTVKPGDTIGSIAKNDIQAMDYIYARNPEVKTGIKEGQQISLPVKSKTGKTIDQLLIDLKAEKK